MQIEIVSTRNLSVVDAKKINLFRTQEFGIESTVDPNNSDEKQGSIYFLLKADDDLLALAMVTESPLKFRNESVSVLCISTVIAIQKGLGYGMRVLAEIQKYAKENGRTLLGFCETDLIPYYKKCDFKILSNEENQFVYIDEKGEIIPKIVPGEVFYCDGADGVISRILTESNKQVKVRLPSVV